MLGSYVPDLSRTPCPVCELSIEADAVVWDPWYLTDLRLAAMPLHPACAEPFLPPPVATAEMKRCGICTKEVEAVAFEAAFAALHKRFETPAGTAGAGSIVWRLAGREPRLFVAEHFDCIIGKTKS